MRERELHQLPVLTEHTPTSHTVLGALLISFKPQKGSLGSALLLYFSDWDRGLKSIYLTCGCRANKRERKPGCEHNQFASRTSMLSHHAILPTDRTLITSASPKHSHPFIFLGFS